MEQQGKPNNVHYVEFLDFNVNRNKWVSYASLSTMAASTQYMAWAHNNALTPDDVVYAEHAEFQRIARHKLLL